MGWWNYITGGSDQYVQRTYDNFNEVQKANEVIFGTKPDYVKPGYSKESVKKEIEKNQVSNINQMNEFRQAIDNYKNRYNQMNYDESMKDSIEQYTNVAYPYGEDDDIIKNTIKNTINDYIGVYGENNNLVTGEGQASGFRENSEEARQQKIDYQIHQIIDNSDAVESSSTNEVTTASETPEPKSIPDVALTIFQINSKAYEQNQKKLQEKYNSNSSLEITDSSSVMKYHKKVSLNVAPISKLKVSSGIGNTEWGNRLKYVLGKESTFLYELFHNEGGIVFPYTPRVDFEHKVNYERTEIMHSNLAVSHYKNTPPPTITLQADFTADGEDNARYMYGVIHFLRAISKCEFGESLFSDDERKDYAGIPPTVLYLNGYGNYMINVPVVVTSFGINFEKNKHYVHLKPENVWLPTDITITINLEIQFNLDKYKKQFDLEKYKENTLGKNNIVSFNNIFYLMTEGEYINKDANGNEIDRKKGKKLSEYNIESKVRLNGSGWTW